MTKQKKRLFNLGAATLIGLGIANNAQKIKSDFSESKPMYPFTTYNLDNKKESEEIHHCPGNPFLISKVRPDSVKQNNNRFSIESSPEIPNIYNKKAFIRKAIVQ